MKKLLLLVPLTGLLLIACQKEKEYPIDPTLKEWIIASDTNVMREAGTYAFNGGSVRFSAKTGAKVFSNGTLYYGDTSTTSNSRLYVQICQKQTKELCGYAMFTSLAGFDQHTPGGGK